MHSARRHTYAVVDVAVNAQCTPMQLNGFFFVFVLFMFIPHSFACVTCVRRTCATDPIPEHENEIFLNNKTERYEFPVTNSSYIRHVVDVVQHYKYLLFTDLHTHTIYIWYVVTYRVACMRCAVLFKFVCCAERHESFCRTLKRL